MKLSKVYILLACASVFLGGCGPAQVPEKPEVSVEENTESNTAPPKAEDAEQETEEQEEEQFRAEQLYHPITAEGIDYLSVEGIALEEKTGIALVGKEGRSTFWSQVKKGAARAVEDLNEALGYTGKNKIRFTFDAPAQEDVIEQINIIDQFLDKAPDALCVAFSDAGACTTQMELARNNGVTLFAVDSADSSHMTEGFVATDNAAAAREAAARLFDAVGENSKVAVIAHSSLTQTGVERTQAIIDEMTTNYNDKRIQFVTISYMAQEGRTEAEVMSEILEKYPDLTGVICTNQNTTEAVIDYVRSIGGASFKIVGFDASEKILNAVQEGLLEGTIAQDPYGMGYATIVAAARSLAGMENAGSIYTDFCWINSSNLTDDQVQCLLNY